MVVRWGSDSDLHCERVDAILEKIAPKLVHVASFCSVDLDEVPDFKAEHKLYDPCTLMFFYRNKAIELRTGRGCSEKQMDSLYPLSAERLKQALESTHKLIMEKERKAKSK